MQHRPEIDGLRALAVLPVLLFHAGVPGFSGGFVGVDIFFVISGYLITSIILADLHRERFRLLSFYERRARRILPALFLVMGTTSACAVVFLAPADLVDFAYSVLATTGFLSNFLFWYESGYFDSATEMKPLLHTWSLAVEEQYYLLFPVLLIALWRLPRRIFLIAMAVLGCLSLSLAHLATTFAQDPRLVSGAFYLLPTRGWELLAGAALAFPGRQQNNLLPRAAGELLSLLGLLLISYAVFRFDSATPFPSLWTAFPVLGAVLLLATAKAGTRAQRVLSFGPLVTVGLLSYSAYLWHQPILAFARHGLSHDLPLQVSLALVFAALCFAFLSWRYVEQPFRDRGRIGGRALWLGSAVSVCFLGALSAFVIQRDGYFATAHQINVEAQKGDIGHDEFHAWVSQRFEECENLAIRERAESWQGFLRCQQNFPGKPSVIFYGDSHAEHLFPGFAERSESNAGYWIRGGVPFSGSRTHQTLLDAIIAEDHVKLVFFAAYWSKLYERLGEDGFKAQLKETLWAVKEAGKLVVLVADTPDFKFDAKHCRYGQRLTGKLAQCGLSIEAGEAQRRYVPALTDVALRLHVPVFDPWPLFCGEAGCNMTDGGAILYRDNDHLNLPGSRRVGQWLVGEVHRIGLSVP